MNELIGSPWTRIVIIVLGFALIRWSSSARIPNPSPQGGSTRSWHFWGVDEWIAIAFVGLFMLMLLLAIFWALIR